MQTDGILLGEKVGGIRRHRQWRASSPCRETVGLYCGAMPGLPRSLFNPLLYVIEQARQVLMWDWILALVGGALAARGGFAVFQRTRGFADVL